MLCQFLLYNKVTQIYVYISPLPLEPSSHWPPFQPSRSSPSTTLSFPCFRFPFLLYVQQCIYVDATLSTWPTLSFPQCPQVHAPLLHLYSCPANRLISTYDGILLSHKKEYHWVICSDVDECRFCHTEWSKSEREKQIPRINACIWKLPCIFASTENY